MARRRVLSSFVVTVGVLALLVAFSLNKAKAQAEPASEETTLVAYHPVAGLIKGEFAAVHIVNLGRDNTAAAEAFDVMFIDPRGALLIPEQHCEIRAGETCTILLSSVNCPAAKGSRCAFRAVVVGAQMACVTPDMGTGEWYTNLELMTPDGASKYVGGESGVLKLPTDGCTPSPDAPPPSPDFPSADAPAPLPDVASPDAPPPPDAPPSPDAPPPPDTPPSPDAPAPDAAFDVAGLLKFAAPRG